MIKKSSEDFTKGNVDSKLLKFTVPIVLGNILMQLYNYVDTIIVGQYVGKEALAAVGAASPVIFMLVALVIGISIGSTIMIGQFYGNNNFDAVRKATDSLYLFLLITSVVISALGILFSEAILEIIGIPAEVVPYGAKYLKISMVGFVFLFLFNAISAILRGVGDSKTPLIFLAASAFLNIILDLVFVIVYDLGIEGVAWASVFSQFLALFFAFIYTSRKNKLVNTNLFNLKVDKKIFMQGVKLGIPAGIQQLAVGLGSLAIVSIVAPFGLETMAGYSAAIRVESFIFVIPISLSMGITSFVSQNHGAGLYDRVKQGIFSSLKMSIVVSSIVMIILGGFATHLISMFTSDPEVIKAGVLYLHVLAPSFYFFAAMQCLIGSLRGVGNTIVPMITAILSLWLIRVPLASFLSSYYGEMGIWLSATLAWFFGMAASLFYIFKYNRKNSSNSIK